MKKISTRKLGLSTQTIRDLAPAEMAKVAGGNSFYCSNWCTADSRCECNVSQTWCGRTCPI
jgi:hypothetical protein